MGSAQGNRQAWDIANQKYVDESSAVLEAADGGTLLPLEVDLLDPVLSKRSVVLHLQSGNGTDDAALARLRGSTVIGVDFSAPAARSAQRRARTLMLPVAYAVGDALQVPLASSSVDLVYTGKGALMWLPDLRAWAGEVARVVRPGGHVFLYDAHPIAPMWAHDTEATALRTDRSYFEGARANDTFPASAIAQFSPGSTAEAIEWQWTLADVVTTLLDVGFHLLHLGEHPEPFWRAGGSAPKAAEHLVPNSFSLMARKHGGQSPSNAGGSTR